MPRFTAESPAQLEAREEIRVLFRKAGNEGKIVLNALISDPSLYAKSGNINPHKLAQATGIDSKRIRRLFARLRQLLNERNLDPRTPITRSGQASALGVLPVARAKARGDVSARSG